MSSEQVTSINSEAAATRKALDALDTLSEQWAQEINLRGMAENMARAKDVPAAIEAIALQAWVEGAYAGRTSHQDSPRLSTPTAGEVEDTHNLVERLKWQGTHMRETSRGGMEAEVRTMHEAAATIRQLQARNAEQAAEIVKLRGLLAAAIGPAGGDFCMNFALEAAIDAAISGATP